MSTVQATNLKSALSTTNNAIMTAGGDFTNAAGISYMGGTKNLLINSAMQVAQRATSVAGNTSGGYLTADRWNFGLNTLGTWTESVEIDGPTGSGLTKSLKVLCTTADASPAAADIAYIMQILEGQDLQRIAKGTASAQQLTLSFWVKSNKTGTYVVELRDLDNTRHVCATYSVSASAAWEKKTLTFPADTTGAFDNDNAGSLYVNFYLASGSDATSGTLATSWASRVLANAAVGQTNLAAATSNYWQITGTQLEVGSAATSFEFEDYGTTLRKCQRYYYRTTPGIVNGPFGMTLSYTTTNASSIIPFPVTMRAAPAALEQSGNASDYRVTNGSGAGVTCSSVPVFSFASLNASEIAFTVASGLTAGNAGLARSVNATAYLAWSAEL